MRKRALIFTHSPELVMQSGRSPQGDEDVKRWLRSRPETERLKFIERCVAFRGYGYEKRAMEFATSSIQSRAAALTILRLGLVAPDASSVLFWLKFAVKKLGPYKLISELTRQLELNARAVGLALYWLPRILPLDEQSVGAAYNALHKECERRGCIRGPIMTKTSDGRVLFKDIQPSGRPAAAPTPEAVRRQAFPANLGSIIDRLQSILCPPTNDLSPVGSFAANCDGEVLLIPSRIYAPAPDIAMLQELGDVERSIVACWFMRHHDGHVRERFLRTLRAFDRPWIIAYVVALCGEYVVELIQYIWNEHERFDRELLGRWLIANGSFYAVLRCRMASYWGVNSRPWNPRFSDYVGSQLVLFFNECIEKTAAPAPEDGIGGR